VSPSVPVYLIDTDVLEHIRHRSDSAKIYSALVGMAKGGSLKTVKQVFGELKKHNTAYGILHPHEKHFLVPPKIQYCTEVQLKLDLVRQHAEYLWPQTGGKNPDPADPWLVAVAAAHGYALVTDESQTSTACIPAACRHPTLTTKCISGPHFLIEVGVVTEIKPEHISPHAFFGIH